MTVFKVLIVAGLCVFPRVGLCTITFANRDSSCLIKATQSSFKIGRAQNIIGWTGQSIVKDNGYKNASTWAEFFSNGAMIAQSGGSATPSTDLTYSTSNALYSLSSAVRVSSNAILFGDRINSNTIVFPPISAVTLRVTSNAIAFGDRNNSNALAYKMKIFSSIVQIVKSPSKPHLVMRSGDQVYGLERLSNGFTIDNSSGQIVTGIFDSPITVSGGIDLRGQLLLIKSDLLLDSGVTITSGGVVQGPGKLLFSGNLSFSPTSTRVLHINTNMVIDGKGGTLTLGDYAQIFVDNDITLTLKNMVFKASPKSSVFPPIQLGGLKSRLALDRVVIPLATDFNFSKGQLFIHNDVRFTGTSAFVYNSPSPSYITSGANLIFDLGTTLSYAPSTNATNTTMQDARELLVMMDASARLSLNGCNLLCTHTGMRLTQGLVSFDNRVQVNSVADYDLATSTTTPAAFVAGIGVSATPTTVAWSPNGRFLAVYGYSNPLQIYSFDSSNNTISQIGSIATSNGETCAWSPDGRFIAVVGSSLQVYFINMTSAPSLVSSVAIGGGSVIGVAWSPDGNFIGISTYGSSLLRIYSFNGFTISNQVGRDVALGASANQGGILSFSPDGKFIACTGVGGGYGLQVYSFNGLQTPTLIGANPSGVTAPVWSPDGRFIAASTGAGIQLFSFNRVSSPTLIGTAATVGANRRISWSPDGRFIAVGNGDSGANGLQIYLCNGVTVPTQVGSTIPTGNQVLTTAWSPDGNYIALSSYENNALQIFKVNKIKTLNGQAYSSSIVFGNSTLGSSANANVQMLSGVRVELNGMMKDDSA